MSAAPALARLMKALPKEPLSPDTFATYVNELADIAATPVGAAVLDDAVSVLLRSRTQPWFPTIGEIRMAAAEVWLDLPTEPQALAQVDARITWGRDATGSAPAVHPLVVEALGMVGGYAALRSSEDPAATRGRFCRVYREARHARVAAAAVGPMGHAALGVVT